MRKLAPIAISMLFTAIIACLCLFIFFSYQINMPNKLEEDKILLIENGSSVRSIASLLYKEHVINNNLAFIIKARLSNRKNMLKAGEYKFSAKSSICDVISLLQSGKTYSYEITIPEGLTSKEIIEIVNSNQILGGNIIEDNIAEGSLLPETYKFTRNDTKQNIVKRMQKAMSETLDKLWESRQNGLPLKSKEEALILASIVEKETGIADERARIAGVFINRLNKGIALQTDPTVIYSITEGKYKLERALTYKDLKTKSPYNTYIIKGLPPTPIANPGINAIDAALNPEINDYIYFVADGSGGHVFSETLEQHNKNVAKWRKIKKQAK